MKGTEFSFNHKENLNRGKHKNSFIDKKLSRQGVLSSSSLFRSGPPCEQLRVHHTIEDSLSQVGFEID